VSESPIEQAADQAVDPATEPSAEQAIVRLERPDDADQICAVHRQAFGQDAEGQLVDALRRDGDHRVSLVAEVDAGGRRTLIGHVLFGRLDIVEAATTGLTPSLALAPVAVLPEWQRKGIGSRLIRRGLETCREAGFRSVVVLGSAQYYGRFGFRPELAARFECVYAGEHLMALELVPGGLPASGKIEYPLAFSEL
jgi:putative acetyltransferase